MFAATNKQQNDDHFAQRVAYSVNNFYSSKHYSASRTYK